MIKIKELLSDVKLNQQIQEGRLRYIEMCIWRLMKWKDFIQGDFGVEKVEDIRAIHVKRYIQYRQQMGQEKTITINNNISKLKVFF